MGKTLGATVVERLREGRRCTRLLHRRLRCGSCLPLLRPAALFHYSSHPADVDLVSCTAMVTCLLRASSFLPARAAHTSAVFTSAPAFPLSFCLSFIPGSCTRSSVRRWRCLGLPSACVLGRLRLAACIYRGTVTLLVASTLLHLSYLTLPQRGGAAAGWRCLHGVYGTAACFGRPL